MKISHFIISILIALITAATVHADSPCPIYKAEEIRCSGKGLILSSWKEAGACTYSFIPNFNACYDFSDFRKKHKLNNVAAVEAELRKFAKEDGCKVYLQPDPKIGCPESGDALRLDNLITELGLKRAI